MWTMLCMLAQNKAGPGSGGTHGPLQRGLFFDTSSHLLKIRDRVGNVLRDDIAKQAQLLYEPGYCLRRDGKVHHYATVHVAPKPEPQCFAAPGPRQT